MKKFKFKLRLFIIFTLILLLIIFNFIFPKHYIKIILISEESDMNQKYWVGGKNKIIIKKFLYNQNEKISLKISNISKAELSEGYLLAKSSGIECLTAYTNEINTTKCLNINITPKLKFKDKTHIKIEVNNVKQLYLEKNDYPKIYLKYRSNHPDVIKIDNKGKISALRPGNAIISVLGLDNKTITQIKVLSTLRF